jgi:phosphoglycolate phosphatase
VTAKTVFFDLDGTLTDPGAGITRSIQYALGKIDESVPDAQELDWCIGPPLKDSFARLVGPERAALALEHYRSRFGRVGWRENAPYPGITGVLRELTASGIRLYVVTSKPHVYANRIVEYFDLVRYFDAVFGPELDCTRSDKSELLRVALEQTGSAGDAVMVGDRRHDVVAALANGVSVIGVTYGYGTEKELLQAGAERLVHQPAGLLSELI